MDSKDIAFVRSELEMSIELFAKLLNVDARSVVSWEAGKSGPGSAAKAVIIGLRETIVKGTHHKSRIVEFTKSSANVGGLAYLIVRLFDNLEDV